MGHSNSTDLLNKIKAHSTTWFGQGNVNKTHLTVDQANFLSGAQFSAMFTNQTMANTCTCTHECYNPGPQISVVEQLLHL